MATKIKNPQDLVALKQKAQAEIGLRSGPREIQITVHMGTCGIAAGARDVLAGLMEELAKAGIENVTLRQSGCLGLCDREPMMTLQDKLGQQFLYGKLTRAKVRRVVAEHVLSGNPVTEDLIRK